ncbi:MAG: HAD family hydrolase [Planctomycetota bacterium]|nr:HAD family hydrolase [Planctomycetota bacterium]
MSLRLCLLVSVLSVAALAAVEDPLPSWNDGATKQAIVSFVNAAVSDGGPEFVPVAERIAVFDNDGTLWSEQPLYFQLQFALDQIVAQAPAHPEWETTEPFASVLAGDIEKALAEGDAAILALVMATHGGMSADDFQASVRSWLETARHPKLKRRYDRLIYQPMVELLVYLRANEFKTYIVSGGGIDFIRVFAQEAYGIPPEQVIGSRAKASYELRDGVPTIVKHGELEFLDDKADKPVAIHQIIGRRPVFAAGNSDGDFAMLEWTTAGAGPRFGLLVHHTDVEREWAYDRESHIGKLVRGLDEAAQRGWALADMAADWRQVFPAE